MIIVLLAGLPSSNSKSESRAGLPAVATLSTSRVKCPPSPSLRRTAFVLAPLGEGWWSTSPFSTNERVLNFSREQNFGPLN